MDGRHVEAQVVQHVDSGEASGRIVDEVGHEWVRLLGEWSMIKEGIVSGFFDQVILEILRKLVCKLLSTYELIQEHPCFFKHVLEAMVPVREVHFPIAIATRLVLLSVATPGRSVVLPIAGAG
jgi:hypothetical protein